jgi:hypothetical protein
VSADGKNTTFEVVNRKISNQTSTQENTNPNSVLTERVVLVNGQEAYKLPINDQIIPRSSDASIKQNMLLDSVTYYWWDNVYFGQGDPSFQYPHPDRTYYSIPTYANWLTAGNNLWHFQFSDAESGFLANAGAAVFAGEVGALIAAGTFEVPIAAALIDAFVVPIVYAAITAFEESTILDEESCLWFWISQFFVNWLYQNQWYLLFLADINPVAAVTLLESAFYGANYFRIGSLQFVDSLGIGQPGPPPDSYYVSSITHTQAYGYGAVNNPNGLIGSSNDGSYVQLWGGNPNDGGQIVGSMNQEAHGHVYLYGHSGNGYYTHLYVWVSYNNNGDWGNPISVQTVSGTNDRWIDCNTPSGNFRYIAIVGIDDNGMSSNIFIDSVKVQP